MGTLYICATPIGNLNDASFRLIETLKNVSVIACEDTRNTIKLLNHFDIKTKLIAYHEHNKVEAAGGIIDILESGKDVALVSDAGTPLISDPGDYLVGLCISRGIKIIAIPGPCALISALTLSGMNLRRFCFEGFLPEDKKERKLRMENLVKETRTMVFYVAPHDLKKVLKDLVDYFGGDRKIAIVRELTKIHEENLHMTLGEALEYYEQNEAKGEFVLVVEGEFEENVEKDKISIYNDISLQEHLQKLLNEGFTEKDAIKEIAKLRGLNKREVYRELKVKEE